MSKRKFYCFSYLIWKAESTRRAAFIAVSPIYDIWWTKEMLGEVKLLNGHNSVAHLRWLKLNLKDKNLSSPGLDGPDLLTRKFSVT